MHTKGPKEDPLVDLGYEQRDINFNGVGVATVFFLMFAGFCFAVVAAWYIFAKPKIGSHLDPRKPLPSILLQDNMSVREDIQSFRQNEEVKLTTSGPNPDGTYHIPIEQAMALIVKNGLPHVTTNVQAVSPGNTIKQNALQPGQHVTAPVPLGGTVPGQ